MTKLKQKEVNLFLVSVFRWDNRRRLVCTASRLKRLVNCEAPSRAGHCEGGVGYVPEIHKKKKNRRSGSGEVQSRANIGIRSRH
jgi:hypothetical protein